MSYWRLKKSSLALAVVLILFIGLAAGQTSRQSSFYQQIQHAVIQLQHVETSVDLKKQKNKIEIYNVTAFFVQYGNSVYIVTDGHVAR